MLLQRYFYVKDVEDALEKLKDADDDRRRAIVEFIGKEKDPIATEPLSKLLEEDRHFSVRSAAAQALGEIGDARAVESLILALEDEYSPTRWLAAEALGKIGDERAVESLIESLNDEERWVQDRAAEALGKIGDTRAVSPLIEALATDRTSVRENIAGALGKLGDVKAIGPLTQLLDDGKKRVQIKAINALGEIGRPALGSISQALNHKNRRVRKAAKAILETIDSDE